MPTKLSRDAPRSLLALVLQPSPSMSPPPRPSLILSAGAHRCAARPSSLRQQRQDVSLADFKGKPSCSSGPTTIAYVRKHYGGNNMQTLQKKRTAQGGLADADSSAPGTEGCLGREANSSPPTEERRRATPVRSQTSRLRAQVTPHMYVIKGDGTLVYMGGIDDKPTARLADLKTAKNFVDAALSEMTQGKPVSVTTSRPYGCSIKYSS
jgi:hypothetical protein